MMNDNELDNLLNEFLADETSDNNEQFVQSVMKSLPPEEKISWVREFIPATGVFILMLMVWKFKLLTPSVLLALGSNGLSYLQTQWGMLSPMTAMAIIGLVLFGLARYTFQTYSEI